ncbi:AAA family ATPase [Rhodopseudomonas sp. RCAM05734]|uniref:AAA family ATPase n=1 Tax=Rhodopseudomonas sp. RCAM05734 TaxID=3457549 RepID=UPI004043F060
MLLKIDRIRNLGVFADYSWNPQLPPFERYNVIYGENGSGKTTLSRLLDCLKTGKHDEYPTLEFKIGSQSGDIVHNQAAARKIRVFNADYVQLNIGQLDGSLKPILVIGAENKAVAEALAAEQLEEVKRLAVIQAATKRTEGHQTGRGKIFTEIAKTISEAVSGNTARTYRKNNAELAFSKLVSPKSLTDEVLQIHRSTIHQEVMETIGFSKDLQVGGVSLSIAGKAFKDIASKLCARSAVSDAIARLTENPEIALWVEEGHALHKELGSKECEFCRQAVPAERWKQLDAHFSTADRELKDEIEGGLLYIERLKQAVLSISLPDRMALYSDLRGRFHTSKSAFEGAFLAATGDLDAIVAKLTAKLASRSSAISFELELDLHPLEEAWADVVAVIEAHNAKTATFDQAKNAARAEIEIHYLASVRDSVAEFDRLIEDENEVIREATEGCEEKDLIGLKALQNSISQKKAQLSNAHKAGEQPTQHLHTFLGRNELVFRSDDDGYRVYRNGKPARRLSEGERTAVAFIYFIVQLGDQDFNLKDGVVVIDDPVSSLDASSLYQAFAFLKNAVKDAKQVFLLTHNFSFLRLVLNWLESVKKSEGKKQFYMLVCKADATGRYSSIVGLDRALIDHPTEYHFLFKTLATFQSDGTIAGCYHIPNVTRKVLETFLDFHVPERKALYAKLADVPFDENKKAAIYKFANDLSHFTGQGFEPGLVQESQKNAAYLLEMIKELAPQHYQGMISATQIPA